MVARLFRTLRARLRPRPTPAGDPFRAIDRRYRGVRALDDALPAAWLARRAPAPPWLHRRHRGR